MTLSAPGSPSSRCGATRTARSAVRTPPRSLTRSSASSPTTSSSAPASRQVSGLMATIRIPPVLRSKTGGDAEVEASGSNVGEVLRSLTAEHPDTDPQLFGPDGDLNRYVNVYLNDEDVRVLDGLDTAVSDGDVVVIL